MGGHYAPLRIMLHPGLAAPLSSWEYADSAAGSTEPSGLCRSTTGSGWLAPDFLAQDSMD